MKTISEFKNQMQNTANVNWWQETELEMFWPFEVAAPIQHLWHYISDTSRFNRELGLAPRTDEERDGKLIVTTTLVGLPQQWIEEPWSWVEGRTIKSERTYIKGVAKKVQAVFHLEPLSDQRTRVYIYFGWTPTNGICNWFLSSTQNLLKSNFAKAFAKIEDYHKENPGSQIIGAFKKPIKNIAPEQELKMRSLCDEIRKFQVKEDVLQKFCDYVKQGDDLDLDAIKVLRLAYEWSIDYKELLKICLHASKLGMLNISWNLICPHCKGSRFSAAGLGDIPKQAACEPCGVEFGADAVDAVEIVFKIHPSVRAIPNVSYCAAEPAKKMHIKVQQSLPPGKSMTLSAPALAGIYRIRVKNNEHELVFKVSEQAVKKEIRLNADFNSDLTDELHISGKIHITNPTAVDAMVNVVQLNHADFSLRPQHLLFFPEFKELFAEEHLRSDVKLHLGHQALLFTDVVGSTAYYEKVGDAKAFDEVRRHFVDVFSVVKSNNGEIVKTIGDAVMSTFPTIEQAFAAAEKIQKKFDGKRSDLSLRLRISIHAGVVIAVYLDSGMDYFGSVINKCAKIQSLAGAGEVVMTEEVSQGLRHHIEKYSSVEKVYDPDSSHPQKTRVIKIS